jgi:uncharacterized membrane protein
MSERISYGLNLAAILGSGLIAGVFLAFSSFVMAALAKQPFPQGMQAMQSINVTVINPVFMAVLFGTGLVSAALGINAYRQGLEGQNAWLLAAALLYILGVIGVTIALNVPLNNALAAADPNAPTSRALWDDYVSRWTMWNSVRMLASLAACAAFAQAIRTS